jgi:serine/threonine protein kinase/Tfp pilus assembly protein PilF
MFLPLGVAASLSPAARLVSSASPVVPFFGPILAPNTHCMIPRTFGSYAGSETMADRQQFEKSIFLAALEKTSAAERVAYLDEACGANQPLRAEVDALLQAHEQPQRLLDVPEAAVPTLDPAPLMERPGTVIGPYKLLQQIGEGGMGTVFMAEQTHPVQRKVALKIIKPGMDSRQVIARFEAERQALALMDHPNIAKVLDAGTIGEARDEGRGARMRGEGSEATGEEEPTSRPSPLAPPLSPLASRPYFVMELVKGIPITQYCDQQHLTPRERLDLFIPVCQALQHAHQKGIIHRDLKPSNVMVCLYDGKPVPKVIDFGVAKATGQKLTDKTMFTEFGQVVGTLEYMSPEQAELNQLDIDTRSDIYSLGVLLYELLTGTTPLDRKRFKEGALLESLRIIREEEPQKPSTRLSTTAERAAIAANRGLEANKLSGLVRGELDWIVMTCLEKDRNRRYETANGLAMDVQRYLHDEAVRACPPSGWYRFRKFARRNKVALMAAAFIALALAVGTLVSTWQAVRATQAEASARLAEQEAADDRDKAVRAEVKAKERRDQAVAAEKKAIAEKHRADGETAIAKEVNEFLYDLLRQADSYGQVHHGFIPEPGLTVKEALNRAAARIGDRFKAQPRVEATIQLTIGVSLDAVGEARLALPHLERAVTLRKSELGPDHPETLTAMNSLGNAYSSADHAAEALALHEKTLERRRATLGPYHADTLASVNNVAWCYLDAGRLADALPLLEQALPTARAKLGADHAITLYSMSFLASVYKEAGRPADALALHKETLRRRQTTLGPGHPLTLVSMNAVADVLRKTGPLAEAVRLAEEALTLHQAKLGPDHPLTLISMNNLGVTYSHAGRARDALPVLEECLKLQIAKLGPDHTSSLTTSNNLGGVYLDVGRLADGIPLLERTLNGRRAKLGPDHPRTLDSSNNLADAYRMADRLPEALALWEETLKRSKAKMGLTHPATLTSMNNLAHAYYLFHREHEAEALYKQVLAAGRPDLGSTLSAMNNLGLLYLNTGRYDEAEALLKQALERERTRLGADHPRTLTSNHNLALVYHARGKYTEAESLFQYVLQRRTATLGADHPATLRCKHSLAGLYQAQGKYDRAEPIFREAVAAARQKFGLAHADTQTGIRHLIGCYERMGQPIKAEPLYRELADFQKQKTGADSPQYAGGLALLGLNLLQQKKWTVAESILRECLAIREKKDPDDWLTFSAKSMLGGSLLGQKKYAVAEPLLLAGYEGMKQRAAKIPPRGKARLPEALERLVRLYEAMDRKDKADDWRKKLEAEKKDARVRNQKSIDRVKK